MTSEKSTDTDSVVLVDHTDAVSSSSDNSSIDESEEPHALQVISIGTEDDQFAFTFNEKKLNSIMSKIPPGWKVSVVSVVGAFRTGKSFLLTWFLRYLHHLRNAEKGVEDSDKPWYENFDSLGNDAFHWSGGSDRNTTGIWMWSQPHFITKEVNGKKESIAILLVDSQGMFDNETTMSLTASIFGLSTLLSSYQIYNVEKRIQEDNLQQLALFSEYARLALEADHVHENENEVKPFQKIEFLVRDWQNFEDEENFEEMEQEMVEYYNKVIADRDAKDLQETREQIASCFENASCYAFVHPGKYVTKKSYSGDVSQIDETFVKLVDRYCKRVFSVENLAPKSIQGREVTAVELGSYIKAYAEMFASGASFPEASTMLEATASANNTNAVNMAINQYKDTMNRIAGPKCSNYIRADQLKDDHKLLFAKSLDLFDSIATFGRKESISGARNTVIDQINDDFQVYQSLNAGRNPLAGMET
jgi:atlastin